jgi:phosphotriesterase-related protein
MDPMHGPELRAMSVRGPIDAAELGVALMHEHMVFDFRSVRETPVTAEDRAVVHRPVEPSLLGYLRFHPLMVLDNLVNTDIELVVRELDPVASAGGRTVVDPTNRSIGRDARALRRISEESGINVIMGAGYYTELSLEPGMLERQVEDIAAEIERDITIGVDDSGIRAGLIGEIGTSSPITAREELSLRGAARAQAATGAPLMVHLDGWGREGHRVLDICASEGVEPDRVILCHMNPSWEDVEYQTSLAERGAHIEYDMFGNNHVYPSPMGPSPDELVCLRSIGRLISAGHRSRILMSQDVYLKMMFRRYGGYGYAHILQNLDAFFEIAGVTPEDRREMLVTNPRDALAFRSTKGESSPRERSE